MAFKTGDIVWVDLGISYGKWPAHYQSSDEIKPIRDWSELAANYKEQQAVDEVTSMQRNEYVRFFDDLPLEYVRLREENNVENYACKQKLQYVRKGIAKHRARQAKCRVGDGANPTLAQFASDVEMAEALSGSTDTRVANLLMKVVQELQDMEDREAAENEKAEANIEPTEDKNQLFVPGADGNTDSKHSKSKYKPNKNRDNSASIPLLMSNFVENTSLRTLMRTSEPNANNDVKLQQDEAPNISSLLAQKTVKRRLSKENIVVTKSSHIGRTSKSQVGGRVNKDQSDDIKKVLSGRVEKPKNRILRSRN